MLVSTLIIWWGTSLLETHSEELSRYYGLPAIVRGAVIVAIGSSFPELATTTLSTYFHGEFELGVAAIVGSAIFNILIIPSLSNMLSEGKSMSMTRALVFKEAQFYIISMAVLLLVFSLGVIYYPVGPTDGPALGKINRLLASMPILLYGLYIFIQYQDTADHESDKDVSDVRPLYSWLLLTISLMVILGGVELLVRAAIQFGDLLGTPSFLWGMTIVAAGTSVPDAIMSIRTAVHHNAETSLANVLGSNVFDLLVCIPAGVMIAGSTVVNFTVVAPMMGFLIFATILLFTFMRTNLVLSDAEAWLLILLYVVFVVWLVAEYFYLVDCLPGVP